MVVVTAHRHADPKKLAGKRYDLVDGELRASGGEQIFKGKSKRIILHLHQPMAHLCKIKQLLNGGFLTGGVFDSSLPDEVALKTMRTKKPGEISRCNADLPWAGGQPGIMTLDYDGGQITSREELKAAYESLAPGLTAAFLLMESSSSGLTVVGEEKLLKGLNRWHMHVPVLDASDIPRAMEALHQRSVIDGHGWTLIGANGDVHVRSPIDQALRVSSQPIYGAPVLGNGLERRVPDPEVVEGGLFDTRSIPSLTLEERNAFKDACFHLKASVDPKVLAERRAAYVESVAKQMGVHRAVATEEIERRDGGSSVLSGERAVLLDTGDSVTVNEILSNADEYHLVTCYDPVEGRAYGSGKGIIYTDHKPTPLIHSLAHGLSASYLLRHDVDGMVSRLLAMNADERNARWARLVATEMIGGDVAHERLVEEIKEKVEPSGVQAVKRSLKAILLEHAESSSKKQAEAAEIEIKQRAILEQKGTIWWDAVNINPITKQVHDRMGGRPLIQVSGALVTVVEGVPENVFSADGAEPPPILKFKALKQRGIRALLEDHFIFMGYDKDGFPEEKPVPMPLCQELLTLQDLGVPHCDGILEHPVVLPTGEVLVGDGFCPKSRFWLNSESLRDAFPPDPNQKKARAALKWLREEMLAEFPFASDFDRDVAIGILLTCMQRQVLPEAPIGLIDGSNRAAGKTALAQLMQISLTGRGIPAMSLPETEEEIEKRVFTASMEGRSIILWDNVRQGRVIESDSIAACATSTSGLTGRVLGESRSATGSGRMMMILTGVGVKTTGDFNSRSLTVRLEPKTENPENRRYSRDIKAWAQENRQRVIRALLTLVSGFARAEVDVLQCVDEFGISEHVKPTRFKEWDETVRFPIIWAGGADIASVFAANKEEDPKYLAESLLMRAIREWQENSFEYQGCYWPVKDLVYDARRWGASAECEAVVEAFHELRPNTKFEASKLGAVLRGLKGQIRDGCTLDSERDRKKTTRWRVVAATEDDN